MIFLLLCNHHSVPPSIRRINLHTWPCIRSRPACMAETAPLLQHQDCWLFPSPLLALNEPAVMFMLAEKHTKAACPRHASVSPTCVARGCAWTVQKDAVHHLAMPRLHPSLPASAPSWAEQHRSPFNDHHISPGQPHNLHAYAAV
jgi:hypothetical protein